MFSLNKGNRWELLDQDNVNVEVTSPFSRRIPFIYQGAKNKAKGYNAKDHHQEDVSNDNSRQARKEARQNRAKNNKNARSGHKKESLKKNEKKPGEENEDENSENDSSSSQSEESDEVEIVEDEVGIRVNSHVLGAQSLAYLRCYQCANRFEDMAKIKYGEKGTKREIRYEMKDY